MSVDYPAINKLVEAMKGVPATNQWDIVCSYNVQQLNQFLLSQYENGRLAKEVHLSTNREDPLTGSQFTINYNIHFASPQLSFVSGMSGHANLIMPIMEGSSYSVVASESGKLIRQADIPTGHSVNAIVPLAAICGDTGQVVEQGGMIEFSDGKEHDAHIIIHFKSQKGTSYSILPIPDPKDRDPLVTYLLPILSEYFQTEIKEVDYALSTLNNNVSSSGQTFLTPSSFVFASNGDNDDGILSLYIQTKESGNPPGNVTPSFQPGDQSFLPVPQGYTASLILSNSLISKIYLQPQLNQLGYDVTFNSATEGIAATLKSPLSVIAAGDGGHYYTSDWKYEGLNVSFENVPLRLSLARGGVTLAWESSTISSWEETQGNAPGVHGMPQTNSGKVVVAISLNKGPVPILLGDNDIISSDLNVSPSDFQVHMKAVGGGDIPRFYTDEMTLNAPAVHFAFQGLNVFSTTNLLAPGKQMIQFDTNVGIYTPHDFLLVGYVTKGEDFHA